MTTSMIPPSPRPLAPYPINTSDDPTACIRVTRVEISDLLSWNFFRRIAKTGLILAAAFTVTIAPVASAQGPAAKTEVVAVTGSNIPRSDYDGPQSMIVIDRQKIERSGARTVTEVIKRLPQNTAGF